MKDLMSLVAICKADLDSLGIKYGRVSNWSINTRAKCRLGQCRKFVRYKLYLQCYLPISLIKYVILNLMP